jgi:hypothetical protein
LYKSAVKFPLFFPALPAPYTGQLNTVSVLHWEKPAQYPAWKCAAPLQTYPQDFGRHRENPHSME